MRAVIRSLRSLIALVLLAAVLCASALLVEHNHFGSGFRPDCPGCHQERTIGSSSAAVTVATAIAPPVPIGLLPDAPSPVVHDRLVILDSPPRSPPLPA